MATTQKYTKANGFVPLKGKEKGLGYKNLNYKNNSSSTGQQVKDVVTGRAAVEGAKVVGRTIARGLRGIYNGTVGNALRVEARHNAIIGIDKRKKKMQSSDGTLYMK